jgi:exopolyphosphatase/pppGpp-phosphohydrolase
MTDPVIRQIADGLVVIQTAIERLSLSQAIVCELLIRKGIISNEEYDAMRPKVLEHLLAEAAKPEPTTDA